MAGNYDPIRDMALQFASLMHTAAVVGAPLDLEPLTRIASRLGFVHGTDPAEIEDKLRGTIERRVRRDMAREVLHLHQVDRRCIRNVGPHGHMEVSLNKISRGEPLPDWRDLHGGEGANHG